MVTESSNANNHKFILNNEYGIRTDQRELMILQSKSSQHIRRLAWWSARTDGGTRIGSTSQFSSDSYNARMKSPGKWTTEIWDLEEIPNPKIYAERLKNAW